MIRLGLLLLALALPPAVYYNTLGPRRAAQWERDDSELRALTTRLEQSQAAQRKLTEFHDEQARLGEELVKLRVILPPAMQIDDVRATAESKAAANGVRLTKFETGGLKPAATPQQQSVEAEVSGGDGAILPRHRQHLAHHRRYPRHAAAGCGRLAHGLRHDRVRASRLRSSFARTA